MYKVTQNANFISGSSKSSRFRFKLYLTKMASKKKTKTRVRDVDLDLKTISELGGNKVNIFIKVCLIVSSVCFLSLSKLQ